MSKGGWGSGDGGEDEFSVRRVGMGGAEWMVTRIVKLSVSSQQGRVGDRYPAQQFILN